MANEYEFVLAKHNFYTINCIGHTMKFVLNPRYILYQDYKKEKKCAVR